MLVMDALGAAETHYRAGTDLIVKSTSTMVDLVEVPEVTLEDSLILLDKSIAAAKGAPVGFEGNVYDLIGNASLETLILKEREKGEASGDSGGNGSGS
jgi:hypothetical protein